TLMHLSNSSSMGGVVVLQPQDLFNEGLPRSNLINSPNFGSINSRRNPNSNSNPNPTFIYNHKPTTISARSSNRSRKRSPLTKSGTTTMTTAVAVSQKPRNALVMEQVQILKRGEALDQTVKKAARTPIKGEKCLQTKDLDDFVLASTDRLVPEPGTVPKQINVPGFYAGSAFIESPPPSSLPVPAFFKKRSVLAEKNDATSDLRRILGLDLV
ncbi:unnamed protein product, partial [Ilex paraguariensis]